MDIKAYFMFFTGPFLKAQTIFEPVFEPEYYF